MYPGAGPKRRMSYSRNDAVISVIAEFGVFLGAELPDIHRFTSFKLIIKNARVQMNSRSTFSFNGKRHLSQVVESVQPPVRSSMQSPLDRHGISLLQTNTQVVCF